MKTLLIYISLAIFLAFVVAYSLGVFRNNKLPEIRPVNLAPSYEIPLDSKG